MTSGKIERKLTALTAAISMASVSGCSDMDPGASSAPSSEPGGASAADPAPLPPGIPPEVLAELAEQERLMASTPDTEGSGPYPAIKEVLPGLPEHVVYHPRTLPAEDGEKLGLYVFGNGGCSEDGASSRLHLLEVASHGYLAIAPGRVLNGPGAKAPATPPAPPGAGALPPPETQSSDLTRAIDWALAEAERPESPFYHRIAPDQVAISGYSCGGLQALEVAPDPRISTAIIMNSGIISEGQPIPGITTSKDDLANITVPMLYILGGPTDIAYENGMDDVERIDSVPVAVANIDVGHGGTYWEPNGGAAASVTVDWLAWILRHDGVAGQRFVGDDCGLCVDPSWSYAPKNLDLVE